MPGTAGGSPAGQRYPLRNSSGNEGRRLAKLEALNDPATIEALEALGAREGWWCAELGAGRGSMVRWLAGRVGAGGRVTAVDRDITFLAEFESWPNVEVVQGDLCGLQLEGGRYDLVHSRSVLMHLDRPDEVVAAAVVGLRPGGVALFEESDGEPAVAWEDPPAPFAAVMVPIVRRWTWARGLAGLLESLGMTEVHAEVTLQVLAGASPLAEFWKMTLESIEQLVVEAERDGHPEAVGFGRRDLRAMAQLLDDPSFEAPFAARYRVRARKPH